MVCCCSCSPISPSMSRCWLPSISSTTRSPPSSPPALQLLDTTRASCLWVHALPNAIMTTPIIHASTRKSARPLPQPFCSLCPTWMPTKYTWWRFMWWTLPTCQMLGWKPTGKTMMARLVGWHSPVTNWKSCQLQSVLKKFGCCGISHTTRWSIKWS